MAQEPDTAGPQITIATPADGAQYTVGQPVAASYSCTDAGGVADCAGPVASGSAVDTSQPGTFAFAVTAHDQAGNASSASATFTVVEGDVGGEAAATLAMDLGGPAAFAPFLPGVPADYTTSLVATVLSTAADATLTVADVSDTDTGHLVNGEWAL
ncbi:MAG TPA: hypothetical protein VFG79_25290, partial [Solirubrobacter sp.]|nr:hypothetical protein [Solirubrobacter sp.]